MSKFTFAYRTRYSGDNQITNEKMKINENQCLDFHDICLKIK